MLLSLTGDKGWDTKICLYYPLHIIYNVIISTTLIFSCYFHSNQNEFFSLRPNWLLHLLLMVQY